MRPHLGNLYEKWAKVHYNREKKFNHPIGAGREANPAGRHGSKLARKHPGREVERQAGGQAGPAGRQIGRQSLAVAAAVMRRCHSP